MKPADKSGQDVESQSTGLSPSSPLLPTAQHPQHSPVLTSNPRSWIKGVPFLIWQFTENDFPTFILPNSAFGIFGALAGPRLFSDETGPTVSEVLWRVPIVILYNWYMTFIFDLANQRGADSVEEDRINKPWRPIPSGYATMEHARILLLSSIPLAMAMNWYLGVFFEGIWILVLVWMYNDLRGGDHMLRDPLIAAGSLGFNGGSLRLAGGVGRTVNDEGHLWTVMIAAVILTTGYIQDLKDQVGDKLRERKSVPILIGDGLCRVVIAAFILSWSFACAYFWRLKLWAFVVPVLLGAGIGMNGLLKRNREADYATWRTWCFWLIVLFTLPTLSRF
ncbi:UbiA prenyltransferase family-domain-containing protein [Cercophora samala]|uniref:UbiA prenyltransferase family-domain-containing protein n=1 Tax=Cercophora samala TaxID=330535 RepID=A0AA40DC66_9PEZI|nr:UbiA prenyltransferase family-domain-containing protein [Cercophora samala]